MTEIEFGKSAACMIVDYFSDPEVQKDFEEWRKEQCLESSINSPAPTSLSVR